MTKLKLGPIPDDKPVNLTVELPTQLHRDLIAYGEILGQEAGRGRSNRRIWWSPCSSASSQRIADLRRRGAHRAGRLRRHWAVGRPDWHHPSYRMR